VCSDGGGGRVLTCRGGGSRVLTCRVGVNTFGRVDRTENCIGTDIAILACYLRIF
jgi:hypothetical protein